MPHNPAFISVGFTGPSVTNTLGKAFFEKVARPVPVGADGSIAASPFLQPGPTGQATLALRQALTFDARKRSVRDAMAYAASLGVTTHLDQGALQATHTPADLAGSEDNYTDAPAVPRRVRRRRPTGRGAGKRGHNPVEVQLRDVGLRPVHIGGIKHWA